MIRVERVSPDELSEDPALGLKRTSPTSRIAGRWSAGRPGEPHMAQPKTQKQLRSGKTATVRPLAGDPAGVSPPARRQTLRLSDSILACGCPSILV